jgi:hypothetical protein
MDEVDKEVEGTEQELEALQDSPTAEDYEVQTEDSAEKPVETPEDEPSEAPRTDADRNWKALREENERLKSQIGKDQESSSFNRSELNNIYLTPDENVALSKEELKAELKFPELEENKSFARSVYGEYRMALDNYTLAKASGVRAKIPSAYEIAKSVKKEIDDTYGSITKKAESEGAKKAHVAKESREATVEAEGRSDRAQVAKSASELQRLKELSRRNDASAIMERLQRSGL